MTNGTTPLPYEPEIALALTLALMLANSGGWTAEQLDAYLADQRAKFQANKPEALPDV